MHYYYFVYCLLVFILILNYYYYVFYVYIYTYIYIYIYISADPLGSSGVLGSIFLLTESDACACLALGAPTPGETANNGQQRPTTGIWGQGSFSKQKRPFSVGRAHFVTRGVYVGPPPPLPPSKSDQAHSLSKKVYFR